VNEFRHIDLQGAAIHLMVYVALYVPPVTYLINNHGPHWYFYVLPMPLASWTAKLMSNKYRRWCLEKISEQLKDGTRFS